MRRVLVVLERFLGGVQLVEYPGERFTYRRVDRVDERPGLAADPFEGLGDERVEGGCVLHAAEFEDDVEGVGLRHGVHHAECSPTEVPAELKAQVGGLDEASCLYRVAAPRGAPGGRIAEEVGEGPGEGST